MHNGLLDTNLDDGREDVCHPVVRGWGRGIDEGFIMREWEGMRGLRWRNL